MTSPDQRASAEQTDSTPSNSAAASSGPAPGGHPEGPDREALLRYVERFALVLAGLGMQRMPARVFAYVLADPAERYTAAELAAALRVSPAAISGAVRTLVQGGLIGKEREPGDRVDTYRVYDDNLWFTIISQRQQTIETVERVVAEGAALLGPDSPGGARMRETQAFYAFLNSKLGNLMAEWQERKSQLLAEYAPTPGSATQPTPGATSPTR